MPATRLPALAALLAAAALGGCSSTYAPSSLFGGYSSTAISTDVWAVRYGGNGYTTEETVQTYWLFHAAELTLAQGYDGFEIVSEMRLTGLQRQGVPNPGLVRVSNAMQNYELTQKPWLDGDIRLLRKPFRPEPGKVFDAAALKAMLEPYVNGPKCGGNVCPHVHGYLYTAPLPGR